MMVFGLVLGGCWKSMFKRFNIGAVLMLLFVVLTTMFVAAEPTSCWKANTLEGSCSVNVTTNASSIKATMEIKEGTNKFGGSITIGSCNIPGTFFSVSQTFEPDTDTSDLFKSPIKVEATSTAVTFQSGTNPKKTLCPSSPFDVQDGLVRTTITLKLESGNIVSLKLDNSISIDNNEKSEKASSVWGIVLICLGASALFIVIVVIIVVVWCCCYRKKKQPVAVSEFKIPDQFEWPSDRFTAEQLDQLLVLFPVLELSAKELDFRTDALLKEHPIKTKGQWDYIKKIRNTYKCKMEKEFLMNREAKPTRAYCMFTIFDSIVHWRPTSESLKKFGNEKTKVTLKQEGPIEKKEVPLEAKKEDQLGTKKEGGLIEKK
ncbi:hypothetical protein M3Y94_00659900 [Aphelenchoides besseyi]|nr:hypothetical protein M3Y94_00659900 [Aphelenchoides besseyi]